MLTFVWKIDLSSPKKMEIIGAVVTEDKNLKIKLRKGGFTSNFEIATTLANWIIDVANSSEGESVQIVPDSIFPSVANITTDIVSKQGIKTNVLYRSEIAKNPTFTRGKKSIKNKIREKISQEYVVESDASAKIVFLHALETIELKEYIEK